MDQRTKVPRIAIVGGGVSGLSAAKHLRHLDPVLFESAGSIGGVWKNCTFRSTKLQNTRANYEFSDYMWKDRESPAFPTHGEILEYLHGYATHFNLWRLVRLETRVVEINFVGDPARCGFDGPLWGAGGLPLPDQPVWKLGVVTGQSDNVEWYEFDFVVMCLGKYGGVPNVPEFPRGKGPEVFQGKVLHSLDYCKLDEKAAVDLMRGKKVVIIGFKKSAMDLAVECAEANHGPEGQPCTMVLRSAHWTFPSYSVWGLPFYLFYDTRFAQFFRDKPNQGLLKYIFCRLAAPMRRGVSKFIESYLAWKLPLEKYGLKPEHTFDEDFASCQMNLLTENFFEEADAGRILFKKTPKFWFWEGGVVLEDGTRLGADVVFLATGFDGKKKLKVLPEPYRDLLVDHSTGVIPLYRGTIHPHIPHMAFGGYIGSLAYVHTTELRSKWLARLLPGHFKLPSKEAMSAQIGREVQVLMRHSKFYRRQCITSFAIDHSDEICEEMGWAPWRKPNLFLEPFGALNNHDYKDDDACNCD